MNPMFYVMLGLLTMAVSIPMIRRSVGPNLWYGFRTPKTLRDRDIWYAANEYSGRMMFIAGMFTAITAILVSPLYLIPRVGPGLANALSVAAFLGFSLWSVVRSFRYLGRL